MASDPIPWLAQADCALLVVSATSDLEHEVQLHGQVRQQLLCAFALGVRQVAVAVNKMDAVGWDKDRFDEVWREVSGLVKRVGYNPKAVAFIPVSGYNGDNILEESPQTVEPKESSLFSRGGWPVQHNGGSMARVRTIIEAIDAFEPVRRDPTKPLRLLIHGLHETDDSATVATGYIVTGSVEPGTELHFSLGNGSAEVESLKLITDEDYSTGHPRDFVSCNLSNISGHLTTGQIAVDAATDAEPRCATSFTAQIMITGHPDKIFAGYTPTLRGIFNSPCEMSELLCVIDRRSGKTIDDSPEYLKTGNAALVKLVPENEVFVEPYENCPPLGRFVIQDMDRIIGVGIIKSVEF